MGNLLPRLAPRAGAWIETQTAQQPRKGRHVAPRAGAWIETAPNDPLDSTVDRLVLTTRRRVAHLTAAGEAALPYWRKAQERTAALVRPSAIGELANQLNALGAREQIPT